MLPCCLFFPAIPNNHRHFPGLKNDEKKVKVLSCLATTLSTKLWIEFYKAEFSNTSD